MASPDLPRRSGAADSDDMGRRLGAGLVVMLGVIGGVVFGLWVVL
jgi:hypothetical protein